VQAFEKPVESITEQRSSASIGLLQEFDASVDLYRQLFLAQLLSYLFN
jgi:hypothetical protein